MKRVLLAMAVVLMAASTALGGWRYVPGRVVVTAPVVHSYWPVGPVYAYPPAVAVAPVVPVAPVAPVVAPATVVAPAPVVVRPRAYIPGRPVRRAVRVVLP
jgi:hypothetical protein